MQSFTPGHGCSFCLSTMSFLDLIFRFPKELNARKAIQVSVLCIKKLECYQSTQDIYQVGTSQTSTLDHLSTLIDSQGS